ncbi:Cysteine, histidine-dependent amidohydrolase/peptidase, partial [Martensiomyces pterosporus]
SDDYPYKSSCGGVDPWNYYKCQCTSFVAFRINKRLGIKFSNHYKGTRWGNANTWGDAARKTGVSINSTPNVNSVAQRNGGKAGHLAWVTSVNGNQITVEEYNWNVREGYGTRTVPKTHFDNYIHLK